MSLIKRYAFSFGRIWLSVLLMTATQASLVGGGAVALGSEAVVNGSNYKPVTCKTAKTYEGKPLHLSPPVNKLPTASQFSGTFDADTVARLKSALSIAMTTTKAQSMSASVARPGQAVWSAVITATETAPEPKMFWWTSAGKMFTAVVVLQLMEEGRLSLSDPISKYVSGVPNGDAITIEHLLNHTSGLFSANEDLQFRANRRRHSLDEELAIVHQHGAMFYPGQFWRYTNTGYSLLGSVIEKVEGQPYAAILTRRVVKRLRLTSLRVLDPNDRLKDVAPLAPSPLERFGVQPNWPGAAGAIVGRAEDMNRFLQALLASELLKPETTLRQFTRLYPMFDQGLFYGLGVMLYEPKDAGLYWLGHSGGAPGANAISIWSPHDNAFVSVALTGDGSAPATASLLLKALARAKLPLTQFKQNQFSIHGNK